MSGELKPTLFVTADAPVQVVRSAGSVIEIPARIVKIGRVWFTVHAVGRSSEFRFRIDNLKPHDQNYGYRVTNEEIEDYRLRVRIAWRDLEERGIQRRSGRPELHDEDLFAIAELLSKRQDGAS